MRYKALSPFVRNSRPGDEGADPPSRWLTSRGVAVVVSLLVGGLARLDASWRGRRAAATVEVALRQVIDREIEEHGFARLTEMDNARASLAAIYQKTSADR